MEQFIEDVERYAVAVGLKPSTIVQRASGASGNSWARWKAGKSCSMRTADQVRAYMAENPPPQPSKEDAA